MKQGSKSGKSMIYTMGSIFMTYERDFTTAELLRLLKAEGILNKQGQPDVIGNPRIFTTVHAVNTNDYSAGSNVKAFTILTVTGKKQIEQLLNKKKRQRARRLATSASFTERNLL